MSGVVPIRHFRTSLVYLGYWTYVMTSCLPSIITEIAVSVVSCFSWRYSGFSRPSRLRILICSLVKRGSGLLCLEIRQIPWVDEDAHTLIYHTSKLQSPGTGSSAPFRKAQTLHRLSRGSTRVVMYEKFPSSNSMIDILWV